MDARISPVQPVREDWGIFELEEGFRLWVRVVVPYTIEHEGPPQANQLRVSTVVVPEVTEKFKGKPTGTPVDFRTAHPEKEYDRVTTVTPCESLYVLPNRTVLTVRLDPIRARRYAEHGPDGDPIVQFDNVIQILGASPPLLQAPPAVALGPQGSQVPAPAKS